MLLGTIVFWIFINVFFISDYISWIHKQSGWLSSCLVIAIVAWIVFSSFYAFFHLMSFLFSIVIRKLGDTIYRNYKSTPPIAILYTCMNDMQEHAVANCLNQEYPDFDLYILDDSTLTDEQVRVDKLCNKYVSKLSIVRREGRSGFKAGNLNNILRKIADAYKYICIVDSDEIIPSTFLRETVAIAEGNQYFSFIQASHQQYGRTTYGRKTGHGLMLHWNYFLPARNNFGFVYFYGHGALLRTETIMSIGGFPELVAEDIALAVKLREAGYRGYYAEKIISYEEAPPSYQAFRRRHKKIASGTLEFISKVLPSFLQSKSVSIVEKIDLIISSSVIYLPIPFLAFLLFLHLLAPVLGNRFVSWHTFDESSIGYQETLGVILMTQSFRGAAFVTFMLFIVLAPACYVLPNAIRSPKNTVLYFFRMCTIYLSVCIQTFIEVLSWSRTQRATFVATGDRAHKSRNKHIEYIECFIGLCLLPLGIIELSFSLMAVGLSLALVPTLMNHNLEGWFRSSFVLVPLLLTIVGLCGTPILALGASSIVAGALLSHH